MFRHRKHRPKIDILPMIDVIFFLLAFFMSFTTFKTAVSGIPIDLPESREAVSLEQRVVVSIKPNGEIIYDSQQVTSSSLTRILKPLAENDPHLVVVINADKKVSYGKLIEVMEAITSAGVSIPALGVEKVVK